MGRAMAAAGAVGAAVALSGCSVDALIWGADGAAVIATTEQLIDAAASGDSASFVCAGYEPDVREPEDWVGLSAEEPERFSGAYWEDLAELDPDWSINLSLPEDRVVAGLEFPGDVFYQQTDDGLCLVGVAWSTVVG